MFGKYIHLAGDTTSITRFRLSGYDSEFLDALDRLRKLRHNTLPPSTVIFVIII
jgi:hypothetical protein